MTDPVATGGRTPRRSAAENTVEQSAGMRFLGAVLQYSSTTLLGRVDSSHFLEGGELSAYQTLINHVRRFGRLPAADALAQNNIRVPAVTESADYYYDVLVERTIYRRLSSIAPQMIDHLRNKWVGDAVALVNQMARMANAVGNQRDLYTFSDIASEVMQEYAVDQRIQGLKGVTTGYAPIDDVTGGLLPGDVELLVGRPNMGKSYILLHSVISAWQSGKAPMICTMEMTSKQLVRRIMAMLGG